MARINSLIIVVVGAILLVCSFIIPFHDYLPAWTSHEGSFTVSAGESKGPSINLFWMTQVKGTFTISGTEDNSVFFFVADSQGGMILPRTLVYNEHIFGFQVPLMGGCRFIVENPPITAKSDFGLFGFSIISMILSPFTVATPY